MIDGKVLGKIIMRPKAIKRMAQVHEIGDRIAQRYRDELGPENIHLNFIFEKDTKSSAYSVTSHWKTTKCRPHVDVLIALVDIHYSTHT